MSRGLKAATSLAGILLASRVLGFFREQIIAWRFGTNAETDAVLLGLSLSDWILAFGISGAQAILPILKAHPGEEVDIVRRTSRIVVLTLGSLVTILLWQANEIVSIYAPGFNESQVRLATSSLWIMLPATVVGMVAPVWRNFLHAKGMFQYAALIAIVQNIVVIIALVLLPRSMGVMSLVWGNAVGIVLVQVIQRLVIPRVVRTERQSRAHNDIVGEVWRLAWPLLLTTLVASLYPFVDRYLGSYLEPGSLSALSYADKLRQIPLAVTSTMIGTLYFSKVTESAGERTSLRSLTSRTLTVVSALAIPAAVVLAVGSEHIVSLIFEHRAFTSESTKLTAAALQWYGVSLVPLTANSVLIFTLYGSRNTLQPLFASLAHTAINIVFSILLVGPYGHVGLAMANMVAAFAYTLVLLPQVHHRGLIAWAELHRIGSHVVPISGCLGLILWGLLWTSDWLWWSGLAVTGSVAFGLMAWFGVEPYAGLWLAIRSFFIRVAIGSR